MGDDVEVEAVRSVLDRVFLGADWAYERHDTFSLRPDEDFMTTADDGVCSILQVWASGIRGDRDSPLGFARSMALLPAFVVEPERSVARV
ncbi:MAG: hypothetical protein ABI072_08125 [Edaphobacter sp.]